MPKTRTRRKMGRTGMRKSKQNGRFNRRTTTVYSKRKSNSIMRRDANKKAKLIERKRKIDLYLKTHIREVPNDNKYKELMERVYKIDNEDIKRKLIKQANPKNFKNIGKQVNQLMRKPLDINAFFRLVLIFWVVQDKLVKHGIKPGK